MLKRLAMFTLATGLVTAGILSQTPKARENLKTPPAPTYNYDPNCCTTQSAPKAIDKPKIWYAHLQDPNWWLVAAAFLTLGFVARQTYLTRKAAEATAASAAATSQQAGQMEKQTKILSDSVAVAQRSADAALLNAQAVINAERPWVFALVKRSVDYPGIFEVIAENKGRTPAMVLESYINFVGTKTLDRLPSSTTYVQDTLIRNKILLPNDTAMFFAFSQKTLKGYFGDSFLESDEPGYMLVIGQITYRDQLNMDAKVIHETRWISSYKVEEGKATFRPATGMGLPDEYERYT